MYVIATVFCSNFHFSVSLHVPFSQFLFERDSYSNEYLLAKFGFDTAENGPKFAKKSPKVRKKLENPWSINKFDREEQRGCLERVRHLSQVDTYATALSWPLMRLSMTSTSHVFSALKNFAYRSIFVSFHNVARHIKATLLLQFVKMSLR